MLNFELKRLFHFFHSIPFTCGTSRLRLLPISFKSSEFLHQLLKRRWPIKLKHLAPSLLWISLIFILSSIPNLGLSFRVSNGAHILVYGILAALIWAGVRNRYRSNWLLITACVIPCFVFGILDELNQAHVPGRSCDPMDVLMDSVGVFLSLFIILTVSTIKKIRTAKPVPVHDLPQSDRI